MVGEIYLAKIYFTNLSSYKIRPVLIIKQIDQDFICLQLSSQIKDERIKISNKDLVDGSLKKDSVVVVPKSFTLHFSIFTKYIGRVNDKTMKQIFEKFCVKIGCIDV